MTVADLEHFKDLLLRRESDLNSWLKSSGQATEEDRGKVHSLLAQIKGALGRVEHDDFGICKVCHDPIEYFKLEVQPISQVCLDCISDSEKELLQDELYLAGKIHRALLPQSAVKIDGFDLAARSIAARNVGGDYFDFFASENGPVRIVVADIMGKGLPAGLLMSNIQGTLRILAELIESPAKLLSRLNTILCRNLPVTKFASMICLSVNPGRGEESIISYANAGHCLPLLIDSKGSIKSLDTTGGVLGVHEKFEFADRDLLFRSGDTLVIYTDGITEFENADEEMFGDDRLTEFMKSNYTKSPDEIIDNLLERIREFGGRNELSDDCTVLVLRKA